MEKGRRLLFWAGILFVFATTSIICIEAQGLYAEANTVDTARADIVSIDTMADYGKLELPEVTFYHDQHTEALAKQGKDCMACHKKDSKGKMSIKYQRVSDDVTAGELKEIYHTGCISCHADMKAAGQKTGPQDAQCRSCHTVKPLDSDWQELAMDKSLHFRHVKATGGDEKCGTCHHKYDEVAKKTVEDKGKEQNCRNCHLATPTPKEGFTVRSYDQAAHAKCVTCHMDVTAKKKDSGPAKCAGCHAVEDQAKYKVVKDTPRLKRGQPDAALLVAVAKKGAAKGKAQANIGPVAFDHKSHEEYVADCRSCHVGKGTMDGKFFELAGDMHETTNMQGCVGCHKAKQEEKLVCAGCHTQMAENAAPTKASCAKCHDESLSGMFVDGKMPEKEVMAAKATEVISARNLEVATINVNDIPETVVIDALEDKYTASKLPHRKIVLRLLKDMKNDKMAGYFHGQDALMCQGCHHRSPVSKTPPKCASCHGAPFNPAKPDMPGLKAAYHGQCMTCHTAMKLEAPKNTTCSDAKGCHVKK